jgi:hypothetical protein
LPALRRPVARRTVRPGETQKARPVNANPSPLHDTIARAFVSARAAMMPHERKASDARLVEWFDGIENTLTAISGPLIQPMLDHPDVPAEVKALVAPGANPQQANELSVILLIVSALIFPLVQGFLEPAAEAARQAGWSIPGNDIVPLSPAELALAVLKNTIEPGLLAHDLTVQGITAKRFATLTANVGNPPGIAELLLLYRRDNLGDVLLEKGVRESRLRDEWLPWIKLLRYAPPTAGEVIAGRIKGHLTDTEYTQKLSVAGIDPAEKDWLLATAGRPLGLMEMLTLQNRGHATAQDIADTVHQSDINDHWLQFADLLRVHYPPLFQVLRAVTAGHMTPDRAKVILGYEGYEAQDIDALVNSAQGGTASKAKELTESQTVRMYGARYITNADATARLTKLGYSATDIADLLGYADAARHEQYLNAVVARVHTRYVAYKMSAADAQTTLLADGIPAAAITDYLHLWNLERGANTHTLTPAAIVGAYRRQQITPLETKQRLTDAGVVASDLAIVVADGFPPTKPNPTAVAAVVNA